MNNLFHFVGIASCAVAFFACSGDNVTNIYEPGMDVIASGDDFPDCNVDNQGKLVFSSDSGRAYFCNQGEWNIFFGEADKGEKGADGESCTARSIDEGVEISCGKNVIDTLVNGAKGDKGDKGAAGKNGSDAKSCTARSIAEGIEVFCDSVVIDTFVNGSDGVGKEGETVAGCTGKSIENVGVEISCGGSVIDTLHNGSSTSSVGGCTISNDADGVVVLDCDGVKSTIYMAECEGVPYNPASSFCLAGKVSPLVGKCGTKDIDLTKQFCDTRDNNAYAYTVVQFNGSQQIWMAEDLKFVTEGSEKADESGSRLYTWYDALQAKGKTVNVDHEFYTGVCPDGWHIPTFEEIYDLANYDGKLQEGGGYFTNNLGASALKSSKEGSWQEFQINENEFIGPGSNELGFSALPKGYYDNEKAKKENGYFNMWSSKLTDEDDALVLQMDIFSMQIRLIPNFPKANYTSVRCMKNF